MTDPFVETLVSGLDDLSFRFRLTDDDGAPVTDGTVQIALCQVATTTPLHPTNTTIFSATHTTDGIWRARVDDAAVAAVLPAVGGRFDVHAQRVGSTRQIIARCRVVAALDARPVV